MAFFSDQRWLAAIPQSSGQVSLATSADGSSWGPLSIPWEDPGEAGVALAAGPDGTLWAAYRGGDGRVWVTQVREDGSREPHAVGGGATPFLPAIAWWHGTLVVAMTGDDSKLYVARGEGPEGLRFRRVLGSARACDGPSLAGTPARLYIAFCGTDGNVYVGGSDDGASFCLFEIKRASEGGISSRPALCSWGPHVAVAAVNDEGHVLLATSHQSPCMSLSRVGGQAVSPHPPAISMDGEGVSLLVAGTDGSLWSSRSAPDSVEFSPVDGVAASAAPSVACWRQGPSEPSRTTVIPVLFYPSDVPVDDEQLSRMRASIEAHMALAQERYRRWLVTDTFPYSDTIVVHGKRPHLDYKRGDAWTDVIAEIQQACGDCNATSTSMYVAMMVRPPGFEGQLWLGSGGPESNEGAGMVLMDARCILEDVPYPFQSTLVHEVGHGFGLPHVDDWGESMETCESIMSYNPRHWTEGTRIPEPEAQFLPEEFFLLGGNEVAFPNFSYDPALHNPSGAPLRKPR